MYKQCVKDYKLIPSNVSSNKKRKKHGKINDANLFSLVLCLLTLLSLLSDIFVNHFCCVFIFSIKKYIVSLYILFIYMYRITFTTIDLVILVFLFRFCK